MNLLLLAYSASFWLDRPDYTIVICMINVKRGIAR